MNHHYHVWCLAVLAMALYLAPAPAESTIVLTHTNMENSTMFAGTRVKKRTGNNIVGKLFICVRDSFSQFAFV